MPKSHSQTGRTSKKAARLLDAAFLALEHKDLPSMRAACAELEFLRDSDLWGYVLYLEWRICFNDGDALGAESYWEQVVSFFSKQGNKTWLLRCHVRRLQDCCRSLSIHEIEARLENIRLQSLVGDDLHFMYTDAISDLFSVLADKGTLSRELIFQLMHYAEMSMPNVAPYSKIKSAINCSAALLTVGEIATTLAILERAMTLASAYTDGFKHVYVEKTELSWRGIRRVSVEISRELSQLHCAYASLLARLGNIEKAVSSLEFVLTLHSAGREHISRAALLNQVGVLHMTAGSVDLALSAYLEAERILALSERNTVRQCILLCNKAEALAKQRRFNEAISELKKALEIANQNDFESVQGDISLELGSLYATLGSQSNALQLLETALRIAQKQGNALLTVKAYRALGQVNMTIDSSHAFTQFSNAVSLARELNNRLEMKHLHYDLCKYYKLMGQASQALFHFEEYVALKDALFTEESQRLLSNVSILQKVESFKAEADKSVQELQVVRTELQRKTLQLSSVEDELRDLAVNLSANQEFLTILKEKISRLGRNRSLHNHEEFTSLLAEIDNSPLNAAKRKHFATAFYDANKPFVDRLKQQYPSLSTSELKVCVFLSMMMESKDIASNLNVDKRTVDNHRLFIRRKLALSRSQNLNQFLNSLRS